MDTFLHEPIMPFPELIRKYRFPRRSAYSWKDGGLFPYYQINRVILVREREVLAALEKFKRIGKAPMDPKRVMPRSPGSPRKANPEPLELAASK